MACGPDDGDDIGMVVKGAGGTSFSGPVVVQPQRGKRPIKVTVAIMDREQGLRERTG
jgi:hypothetical protein